MDSKQHRALVKKHGGWVEHVGGEEYIARFPTVHAMEQFRRECATIMEAETPALIAAAKALEFDAIARKLGHIK